MKDDDRQRPDDALGARFHRQQPSSTSVPPRHLESATNHPADRATRVVGNRAPGPGHNNARATRRCLPARLAFGRVRDALRAFSRARSRRSRLRLLRPRGTRSPSRGSGVAPPSRPPASPRPRRRSRERGRDAEHVRRGHRGHDRPPARPAEQGRGRRRGVLRQGDAYLPGTAGPRGTPTRSARS